MQGEEIIAGLFRAGQLVTLSGGFNVGKSPILMDWAFCVSTGLPWCGKPTRQRPVILFGMETPDWWFRPAWNRFVTRYGVAVPAEPHMFEVFLEHAPIETPSTKELVDVLAKTLDTRLKWVASKILSKSDCLVIFDPFDLFFRIDRNKSILVMEVYRYLRLLHRSAPRSTFIFSFNLRKRSNLIKHPPNLLDDPHGWLEEAAGSLDIQSRSDVRLGMAYQGHAADGIRILNGVRRAENMEPMLLESYTVGNDDHGPLLAGFKPVRLDATEISTVLSKKMIEAWNAVDAKFTKSDLEQHMSRTGAYRMIQRCLTTGLVRVIEEGSYEKRIVA